MMQIADVLDDPICLTKTLSESTNRTYDQRITTLVQTAMVLDEFVKHITRMAGKEQQLHMASRLTASSIKKNSLRLADICTLFRYLYTVSFRHPVTGNPTCDPQVLSSDGHTFTSSIRDSLSLLTAFACVFLADKPTSATVFILCSNTILCARSLPHPTRPFPEPHGWHDFSILGST